MRDLFSRLLIHGGSVALVLVTGIISWQVFGRFVLNSSPSWTEQAALLLMIWYVMLGAAAGVKEGFHIRIALFEQKLGRSKAATLRRGIALIVTLLGLAIMVYGAMLCWSFRGNSIPSLGISRAFAYLPLPLSGALMAMFGLDRVLHPRPDEEEVCA
jgi:TRAP-type C4-dicarboxylate transport system permease small subunit